MTVTVSWTATALGADFARYTVQRLHASEDGWQDIAWITSESIEEFDDHEARLNTQESYRVLVVDTDGITSVPPTASTATATGAVDEIIVTSNVDPTVEQAVRVKRPLTVQLPSHDQITAAHGRDYQRVHRASENLGETMDWLLHRYAADLATRGPDLWRDLVTTMRRTDLSYLAVLDGHGNRWHAAILPNQVTTPVPHYAALSAQFVEVGDTPAVVTVTS